MQGVIHTPSSYNKIYRSIEYIDKLKIGFIFMKKKKKKKKRKQKKASIPNDSQGIEIEIYQLETQPAHYEYNLAVLNREQ